MGPWSRVRVAKCQMLVTCFFILVTGRSGRSGWWVGVRRGEGRQGLSMGITPLLTHTTALLSLSCPCRHVSGAPGGRQSQAVTAMGSPVSPPEGQAAQSPEEA